MSYKNGFSDTATDSPVYKCERQLMNTAMKENRYKVFDSFSFTTETTDKVMQNK